MIDYTTPFGAFFGVYAAFTIGFAVAVGATGWMSPNINRQFRAAYIKIRSDIFGQIFWRLIKAVSVFAGIVGLLGAAMNLERLAEDVYKPDLKQSIDYALNEISLEVDHLFNSNCLNNNSRKNWCERHAGIKKIIFNRSSGSGIDVDALRARLVDARPTDSVEKILEKSGRANRFIAIMETKKTIDPYAKFNFAMLSCALLSLALAGSLGEATYQFRLEWDKSRSEKKALVEAEKEALRNIIARSSSCFTPDLSKEPSFEPPYHP